MELTKQILIHAIQGVGIRSYQFANYATKIGLAKFTGNQWNEEWKFIPEKLGELDLETLFELYSALSGFNNGYAGGIGKDE